MDPLRTSTTAPLGSTVSSGSTFTDIKSTAATATNAVLNTRQGVVGAIPSGNLSGASMVGTGPAPHGLERGAKVTNVATLGGAAIPMQQQQTTFIQQQQPIVQQAATVIQEAPIVREFQDRAAVTEIRERSNLEIQDRKIIKEFHEKPIIELRQTPIVTQVNEAPVFTAVREQTLVEEIGRPMPVNLPAVAPAARIQEAGVVTRSQQGAIVQEIHQQPIIEIHHQPVITEIHNRPMVELHEQEIIRKVYEQPEVRVVREQQQFQQMAQPMMAQPMMAQPMMAQTTYAQSGFVQGATLAADKSPAAPIATGPSTTLGATLPMSTMIATGTLVPAGIANQGAYGQQSFGQQQYLGQQQFLGGTSMPTAAPLSGVPVAPLERINASSGGTIVEQPYGVGVAPVRSTASAAAANAAATGTTPAHTGLRGKIDNLLHRHKQ